MPKPVVLVAEELAPSALAVLEDDFEVRQVDGADRAALLPALSDVDGAPEEHLAQLVDVGGDGIDRLYCHCIGYPDAVPASGEARLAYLRAHTVKADVSYVNTIGRTVQQIRQEAELREAIEAFLDRARPELVGGGPSEVRAAIRQFVASEPRLSWALTPAVKKSIVKIQTGTEDYFPGLSADEKKDRLSRISYRDYFLKTVRADPGVVADRCNGGLRRREPDGPARA